MGALNFPVLYLTDETIDEVECRLASHCEGDWSVELEDVDEELNRKSLKVLFERENDIRALCRPRA